MQDGEVLDVDEITRHLSVDLLGIIFDDDDVVRSSNKGDPIVLDPKNPASQGYRNVARRILGETVPLMSLKKEKESFWKKIFGKRN